MMIKFKVAYFTEDDYTTQYYYNSPVSALRKFWWVGREVPDLKQRTLGVTV